MRVRPTLGILVFLAACSSGEPVPSASRVAPPERGAEPSGARASVDAHSRNRDASRRWWFQQRAYPAARIPTSAYAHALAAFESLARVGRPELAPPGAPPPAPPPPSLAWEAIGPAPLDTTKGGLETPNMSPAAGRASAIAVDPSDSDVIYAGYALGGLWKTTDGGATWAPLMDSAPTLAVGAVAIDPAAPKTIYVGTGEPAFYIGYSGQGILRSTDGGATFTKLGGDLFDGLAIARIFLDGAAGDIYVAATFGALGRGLDCNVDYDAPGQGIYRSSDGGSTWTSLKSGKIVDVEVDTSQTPRRILISDDAAGAFLSDDGGATWIAPAGLPTPQDTPGLQRIELATSAADPSVVYAGMGIGPSAAMFVSADGGHSFAAMPGAPNYCEGQCYYDNTVVADPKDPATLYLGGSLCGVWKTTNATDATPTWVDVSLPDQDCGQGDAKWYLGYVHPDVHAMAIDPQDSSRVYAATDGGVARSVDGGASWSQRNDGVGTVQFYGLCTDSEGTELYGGSQDNGASRRGSTGLTWQGLVSGDSGGCAIDSGDPKRVLVSGENGSILASSKGFDPPPNLANYVFDANPDECLKAEPGCGDRVGFVAPLVSDPSTPGTFYVGTHRLWQSQGGGIKSSWKAVSGDLTAGPSSVECPNAQSFPPFDDVLTTIAVAPGAPSTIYTGSEAGRVFATFDGGANWTRVDEGRLPGRWVSSIAVEPGDGKTVFAAFSGFDEATPSAPGHVFRSSDGGATWSPRDIGADMPVDSLVAHPVATDLLYAGTDFGVLVTTDGGATWSVLGEGLPHSAVYSLVFQRASNTLVAGTFGRSAWAIHFTPGSLSATPAELSFTADVGADAPAAQSIAVHNGDIYGSIVGFKVASDSPWLVVDAPSTEAAGAVPTTIGVKVAAGAMAAGEYDGAVEITNADGGAPIRVPVHLTIASHPTTTKDAEVPLVAGGGCALGAAGSRDERPRLASVLAVGAALLSLRRVRRKRRPR